MRGSYRGCRVKRRSPGRALIVVVAVMLLAGCSGAPVARELNQYQANEIVALLSANGISAVADKESGGRGKYTVTVKSASYGQAVTLMMQNGLPSDPKLSFADLVEPQGFLPNSREVESLRLDRALAVEIEEMLMAHASIANAKTVVRYHLVKGIEQPGVSVIVKRRRDATVDAAQLSEIVRKVLPGILPENISLMVAEDPENGLDRDAQIAAHNQGVVTRIPLVPFLFEWRVAEEDHRAIVVGLILILVVVGAAGLVTGYWYGSTAVTPTTNLPEISARGNKGERPRRDLTEE